METNSKVKQPQVRISEKAFSEMRVFVATERPSPTLYEVADAAILEYVRRRMSDRRRALMK